MSRFSILGLDPFLWFESKGESISIEQNGKKEYFSGNPFDKLKELLAFYKVNGIEGLPMPGGLVGYFAYDLCHHIEKLPRNAADDLKLPDISAGLYDALVITDHLSGKMYVVAVIFSGLSENGIIEKVKSIKALLEESEHAGKIYQNTLPAIESVLESNFTKPDYCAIVDKAKEYIRNGDIYQVNLSQRFKTSISMPPIELYSKLRGLNPAPFAAFLDCGCVKVLSSSPERFLALRGNYLETRPIKGTYPRSADPNEDLRNKDLLQKSEKDRAENLMIVDLMRNDIGKVCRTGSVKATELFKAESYATVHHLVSTVTGELLEECDAIDCLKATFPGGSITGAPKIRAMEIIDELEPTCRSVYTGSIGYIGFDGNMDLNIAIRTILVNGNNAYYQVGGGIVWDSIPENEYEETLHKGLALNRAFK
jgi:para-aminobenzoate synthetase component 1